MMLDDFESECCLDGRIADLAYLHGFVDDACQRAQVDPAAWFDLNLAVEEACANVIEHAYCGMGGELMVRFRARGPDVLITVTDHGEPFDPATVTLPDLRIPLENRPVGGLGLFLMQQLMDDVRFTFSADGNKLEMVKRGVRTATE